MTEQEEEEMLIAEDSQRAMHNKDAQDGIDDYLKWANLKSGGSR